MSAARAPAPGARQTWLCMNATANNNCSAVDRTSATGRPIIAPLRAQAHPPCRDRHTRMLLRQAPYAVTRAHAFTNTRTVLFAHSRAHSPGLHRVPRRQAIADGGPEQLKHDTQVHAVPEPPIHANDCDSQLFRTAVSPATACARSHCVSPRPARTHPAVCPATRTPAHPRSPTLPP